MNVTCGGREANPRILREGSLKNLLEEVGVKFELHEYRY